MRKAGADMDALRGAAAAGAGGIWVLGGAELLALIGVEAAGWVLAGAILAPLAVVAGMLWAIVDLSGPGYRVLRPAALTIAYTRKRLREAWINAAYES